MNKKINKKLIVVGFAFLLICFYGAMYITAEIKADRKQLEKEEKSEKALKSRNYGNAVKPLEF